MPHFNIPKETIDMRVFILAALSLVGIIGKTQQTSNLLLGYQEFPTTIASHTFDSSGNQYFTGSFRGQLTVNGEVLTTGNGLEDVFWVKTNASGKVLRYQTFGSSNTESVYPNSLVMGEDYHMLYSFLFQEQFTLGSFSLKPYPVTPPFNTPTTCLAYADTAGTISWVKRTNLSALKIFYSNNIFHVTGTANSNITAVKVDDSVVLSGLSQTHFVHLMFNKQGRLLGVKTISARGGSVNLINFDFFSDKSLLMNIMVNKDSSFEFNNTPVTLPVLPANYLLLIKTDTAYKNFAVKVLNPQRQNLSGIGTLAFPVCVGPNDSVYAVINCEANGNPLILDGFSFTSRYNTMAVFDTLFKLRRTAGLGTSVAGTYSTYSYKRRIYLKSMFYQDGQFYVNGTYNGTNESPMNVIAKKDTAVKMLPGISAIIDQNGPSRSFVAKIDCNLTANNIIPASIQWYGDHHEYESMTMTPYFFHKGGKDRFVFSQNADNVWNPWIIDTSLNIVTGHMQRNADLPETPQLVQYFNDGSRLVIGSARGRTAMDSADSSFITNGARADIFIARISANDKVLWYKRFFSTLQLSEIRDLQIRDNKAWFLVNYGLTQNDSNYIKIDSSVYSIGTTASLMASVDTADNIKVLNLNNSLLKPFSLTDFSFFSNGDLALVSPTSTVQAGFSNTSAGIHIFRLQPATDAVTDKRKITGAYLPSVLSVKMDKNDQLYFLNGEGVIPSGYTMGLYSTTSLLDTMTVSTTLSQQQNSLLKMNWNDLKWLKRSSGNAFFSSGKTGNLFMVNNKPVVAITGSPNNQPLYWDGKLIHNGTSVVTSSLAELDSNGVMQRSKVIEGFSLTFGRASTNRQIYLCGAITNATKVDTIQVGFAGGSLDGLALVLDSNYFARNSYRVASPYSELVLDMDMFRDSVVALAYTAQGDPQFYTDKIMSVNTGDYQEDAYLGTILTKTSLVTAVNNPTAPVALSIAPNPVKNGELRLYIGVNEAIKSNYAIYKNNGEYILGGLLQFIPGTNYYSVVLPAPVAKGVYHIVIHNKKWITTKTFVVL